jgi:hypothetical protein
VEGAGYNTLLMKRERAEFIIAVSESFTGLRGTEHPNRANTSKRKQYSVKFLNKITGRLISGSHQILQVKYHLWHFLLVIAA